MNTNVSPRLNADLLEEKYVQWQDHPRAVDPAWSAFFEGFELGLARADGTPAAAPAAGADLDHERAVGYQLFSFIYAYRSLGHTQAWLDPLATSCSRNPALDIERFGFSAADLDKARAVARKIRAGWVTINHAFDLNAPFGGYKHSGNGREWSEFGFHEYLEVKSTLGYAAEKG